MGTTPTVAKKMESQQPVPQNGDAKKFLANLNNGINELKTQNLENAKFLRGISRKIENELSQMREIEEGKALEMFDETAILEGIERIENLINTNNITEELNKMNNTLLGFNADVIYLEIEKVNRSLKQINADNVIFEIDKVNENISRLNTDNIMSELNRLEAIVSEINSNAVLAELGRLRMLITEKDNGKTFENLGLKLDMISNQSDANQLEEIKDLLLQNAQQVENMQSKLERIASMPVMLKSIIQSENENNLKRIDDRLTDLNQQQDSKMSGLKTIMGFNLWLSLLAVVLIIVNILGII
ncbi:MAG: hypothetical protein HDT39_00170 [Lachnospiraceae bacterium]|nr:hypothetical protein [Lachnospiraceae bacterium]